MLRKIFPHSLVRQHSGRFSTTKLNDILSLEPFLELKHLYGQAGTFKCNFQKLNVDILIKTVWEDHANFKFYLPPDSSISQANISEISKSLQNYEVSGSKSNIFSVNDDGLSNTLSNNNNNGKLCLLAEIPEYFSLDLQNKGSIQSAQTDIPPKLYGNLTLNTGSSVALKKAKTEFCDIGISHGDLSMGNYLEAFKCAITVPDGSIKITRLSVSENLKLEHKKGNVDVGALYIGQQFIKERGSNSHKLLLTDKVEKNVEKLESLIKASHHGVLDFNSDNVKIQNFQGSALFNCVNSNLLLDNFSPKYILIRAQGSSSIKLTIADLTNDSIILLDDQSSLELKVLKGNRVNVFFMDEGTFFKGQYDGIGPTLMISNHNRTRVEYIEQIDLFGLKRRQK